MSHFAQINNEGIVQRVIVAEQDFINSGSVGDAFNWIQCSYNDNLGNSFRELVLNGIMLIKYL